MDRYRIIEHTADLMIEAFGETLEECFANAGYALFDQTVMLSDIEPSSSFNFEISGEDYESRLYSFLSELLFMEDCENIILKELCVSFDNDKVICNGKGEYLDLSRHRVRTEIKAVTYHMMSINQYEPSLVVIFDV